MSKLDEKVNIAIHRIEQLYLETNGRCYLSFSGGKDSTVCMSLLKMCSELVIPKESIPCVFSNTGLELDATINFVFWCKENYYGNIEIIRPNMSFDYVLKTYGKPIKSKIKSEMLNRYQKNYDKNSIVWKYMVDGKSQKDKKYIKTKIADKDMHMIHPKFDIKVSNKCCQILKKNPFKKYMKEHEMVGYILGERLQEGGVRELSAVKRLKSGGKLCTKTQGKYIVKLPIIDWTDEEVDEYIKKYNVPLSDAYNEYFMKRTGCFLCPYNLDVDEDLWTIYEYEPNKYKASMHWLKDVYIAQNVKLPFDEDYEQQRKKVWEQKYEIMRDEMIKKYRQT